jgi:hypothetical protein
MPYNALLPCTRVTWSWVRIVCFDISASCRTLGWFNRLKDHLRRALLRRKALCCWKIQPERTSLGSMRFAIRLEGEKVGRAEASRREGRNTPKPTRTSAASVMDQDCQVTSFLPFSGPLSSLVGPGSGIITQFD